MNFEVSSWLHNLYIDSYVLKISVLSFCGQYLEHSMWYGRSPLSQGTKPHGQRKKASILTDTCFYSFLVLMENDFHYGNWNRKVLHVLFSHISDIRFPHDYKVQGWPSLNVEQLVSMICLHALAIILERWQTGHHQHASYESPRMHHSLNQGHSARSTWVLCHSRPHQLLLLL